MLAGLSLLAMAVPVVAPAETLYGITFGQQLITIDTATGAGTPVGPLDTPMNGFGLAVRSGKLYTYDQAAYRIRQLDPDTAHTLATIDIGFHENGEGDLAFRSDGAGFIESLMGFYRFDLAASGSALVNPNQGVVLDGLAFDWSDVLFGISSAEACVPSEPSPKLYTIDPATGVWTLVGDTLLPGDNDTGGLAFSSDGTLYLALNFCSQNKSFLYRINKATGTVTLIGDIGFAEVSGIAFLGPAVFPAITLTPASATNNVNTSHTVCATVVTNGVPAADITVTFTVRDGPNAGTRGTGVTDVNGIACFTYSDNGGTGLDFIQGTFVDAAGATNKSFSVSKLWVAPASCITLNCPSNIVVAACTNVPLFYSPTVMDLCCSNWTVVCTPASGSVFAPDTTTNVHCVVTDCASNTTSCDFTVTVVPTTNPPIFHCLTNIIINCGTNAAGPMPDETTNSALTAGNGGPVTVTQSIPSGTIISTPTTNVTLTVVDACGNTNSCKVTVFLICSAVAYPSGVNHRNLNIDWSVVGNSQLEQSTNLFTWSRVSGATNPPFVLSNLNLALPQNFFRVMFRTN
jgi:hypothetical protein